MSTPHDPKDRKPGKGAPSRPKIPQVFRALLTLGGTAPPGDTRKNWVRGLRTTPLRVTGQHGEAGLIGG